MKKSEQEAIIAVAYHEAGHAVIARVLGLEVTSVELNLDLSGVAHYAQWATDFARDDPAYETDAIVSLAGPVAECLYRWPSKRKIASCWSDGDRKTIRRCVTRLVTLQRSLMFLAPKYDELFDQLCTKTWVMVNERSRCAGAS